MADANLKPCPDFECSISFYAECKWNYKPFIDLLFSGNIYILLFISDELDSDHSFNSDTDGEVEELDIESNEWP